MTSAELTVVDRVTGLVIDVRDADTETLATFVANLTDLRAELKDAETVVSSELVARLDRGASWTQSVRDGDRVYTITAPSPIAGTDVYDAAPLEAELRCLVDRGTITDEAARAALKRRLIISVEPPLNSDMAMMRRKLLAAVDITIAGESVDVREISVVQQAVIAGINKLRKVSGTRAALDRAKRFVPAPDRRAKVKVQS